MDHETPDHTHLNPREAPPQALKDLFKLWKGSSVKSVDQLGIISDGMKNLGSVPKSRLQTALANLSTTSLDGVSKNASVFRSDDLPGLFVLPSLLPPSTQKDLLSRLLHRDLSNPKHKMNLHLHYDVSYPCDNPSFFSASPASITFHPKNANVHKPLSIKAGLEKKIRWITLGGQYDWTNKVYPEEEPPEFPRDVAGLIRDIFTDMEPQAAIVNLYSPGDTLSLHRDVSEEVDKGLVSISLGCDAIFLIGLHDEASGKTQSAVLRLRSGDALYMTGESRFAWHAVPKIIPDTCPAYLSDWPAEEFPEWKGWMSKKRINLNIRQMRHSSLASHSKFLGDQDS
ncbi:oxidoreductase [Acephala macrosclerotiorum]|nr:oxidoreductase [Acephala macrosclerotiorum]